MHAQTHISHTHTHARTWLSQMPPAFPCSDLLYQASHKRDNTIAAASPEQRNHGSTHKHGCILRVWLLALALVCASRVRLNAGFDRRGFCSTASLLSGARLAAEALIERLRPAANWKLPSVDPASVLFVSGWTKKDVYIPSITEVVVGSSLAGRSQGGKIIESSYILKGPREAWTWSCVQVPPQGCRGNEKLIKSLRLNWKLWGATWFNTEELEFRNWANNPLTGSSGHMVMNDCPHISLH